MSTQSHWVMDYETMKNLFVAVFVHYKTEEAKVFIIHELIDDRETLIDFLESNKQNRQYHISFNGLNFDSQITEAILRNKKKLLSGTVKSCVDFIYNTAQDTIMISNDGGFSKYPEYKLSIPQIDVFKINHWDNKNKSCSLKWAEFSTDCENVMEMPLHHTTLVDTMEQIDLVANYCYNDVLATKRIYNLSRPLLEVRLKINEKYGLPCMNYSNTRIGSELLLKLYCDKTGQDIKEVRSRGTRRDTIPIKDIMFPYIDFKSQQLKEFRSMLDTKVIINTKNDFKYTLKYLNNEFYLGAGGIHQCIAGGVYTAHNDIIIKDLDVASLYPSIACMNGMYPAHLGEEFFQVYKNDIVDVRLREKQKKENKDMAIIEGFKEAANATYGNSNSQYSWLYDPQYTMQTTINGQLLLLMLVEDLLTIPGSTLLQTNTDGATFMLPKQYEPLYFEKCKEWEAITKLTLEFADYSKMIIADVNNYIAVYTNGKTKCKGRFEWEELQNHKYTHIHKNKSHLIVAKAVYNYFVKGISPEEYLRSNRNILDYCAGVKIKGAWHFVSLCHEDGNVTETKLQKIIRYYISKSGCKILKRHNSDGREIQIESGRWMQTEFNQLKVLKWEEYNVDDDYYLDKIYDEITKILPKPSSQQTIEFEW